MRFRSNELRWYACHLIVSNRLLITFKVRSGIETKENKISNLPATGSGVTIATKTIAIAAAI